jgi:hypothetical protein
MDGQCIRALSGLSNQDIRAKILEELYNKKQLGAEILTKPSEYAKLLAISEELAEFNIEYLIDSNLVKGQSTGSIGTTKKWSHLLGLTSFGIEAVEGRARGNLAVNFNIINVNGPVSGGQIASGGIITQNQTTTVNSLKDLEDYLDRIVSKDQTATIKEELRLLEKEKGKDLLRPSRLNRVKEMATRLGPPAAEVIIDFVRRYLGI